MHGPTCLNTSGFSLPLTKSPEPTGCGACDGQDNGAAALQTGKVSFTLPNWGAGRVPLLPPPRAPPSVPRTHPLPTAPHPPCKPQQVDAQAHIPPSASILPEELGERREFPRQTAIHQLWVATEGREGGRGRESEPSPTPSLASRGSCQPSNPLRITAHDAVRMFFLICLTGKWGLHW